MPSTCKNCTTQSVWEHTVTKIVIIGAGLTGLSAAYHLEKKEFYSFKIFEKEAEIGGLCRSVQQDGFTFDFTGHLLHVNDPYFQQLLTDIFGFDNFHAITRKSFVYSHDTYTPYPYQMHLHGLPPQIIIDCINGYINRKNSKQKPKNFYQWVLQHFGTGFANHFFSPYQQKIFAYDPRKITASWTGRFVPSTTLDQILHGALAPHIEKNIGYNSQFFYPKSGGIISWVNKLAQSISAPLQTNYCVQTIDIKNKTVIFTNGHTESYDQLISTIPLTQLLNCIQDRPSTAFNHAHDKLLCNSVINFNLGINRPDLSDKHWIYFPEKQYPFYRLGFPHNLSPNSVPANCSSLYGEFAHLNKSHAYIQRTLATAIQATQKLLNIADSDIITKKIITIPHAYVIFNFWREQNLQKLLTRLQQESIYSMGRYGEWKYSSMQEAILDGKKIADTLTILPAHTINHPSVHPAEPGVLRPRSPRVYRGEDARNKKTNLTQESI